MVREKIAIQLSRSFNFKRIFEIPGRQAQSFDLEDTNKGIGSPIEEKQYKCEGSKPAVVETISSVSSEKAPLSRLSKEGEGGATTRSMDRQPSGTHYGSKRCEEVDSCFDV